MAIKPTIYKFRISLSDLNRDYYDTLNLTLAQHPSETIERMMVRVLAYCINVQEHLSFTKGLSEISEPDIWARSFDEQTLLWIDVGEPAADRIKKSCRLANAVKIYCFNSKADVWWSQNQQKINQLSVSVYQFDWENIQLLASMVQRTMDISISITGDSAYVAAESGECEVDWVILQESI
ncbi:MAG: YaeQ family protein [Thiohalomonadales bacterium]